METLRDSFHNKQISRDYTNFRNHRKSKTLGADNLRAVLNPLPFNPPRQRRYSKNHSACPLLLDLQQTFLRSQVVTILGDYEAADTADD